jgi:cellulose synthase/poly-beta-1,6-N-acetylglucosamine synthase-like glycosyltransferase
MIIETLELFFLLLTAMMIAYLVRHYIFTLSVLRSANQKRSITSVGLTFEPTVSILIPAFNEEKVIERLLSRLSNITYSKEKLQVIVIDDASSDKTGKIADEYKNKYSFIDVLHRDKSNGRRGKASAMNHGFSKCTGEIVLCFDADYYPQLDNS